VSEDAHSGTVELDVMVTARVPMPNGYVFRAEGANRLSRVVAGLRPGGAVVRSPCLAYAVHHPSSAGTILIDTGMHPRAREDLREDFGGPMSLVFATCALRTRPLTRSCARWPSSRRACSG